MSKLREYNDNQSKTSGSLRQYYRGEPADAIENSESFKSKIRITGKPIVDGNVNVKNVEIEVPLKYSSVLENSRNATD